VKKTTESSTGTENKWKRSSIEVKMESSSEDTDEMKEIKYNRSVCRQT
jgi:hypothetical protein